MDLKQAIKQEEDRVLLEVKRLKKKKSLEEESLKALRDDYNAAIVTNKDEKVIDKINDHIKKVSKNINRCNDKINALTGDNPIIQGLLIKGLEESLQKKEALEEEATKRYRELKSSHKKLLAGLEELNDLRNKINRLGDRSNRISEKLKDKEKHNRYYPLFDNKVIGYMNELLIERGQVFRRWQ